MNKFIEILAGLILLVLPIYAWITNFKGFGDSALIVLKGGIVWALLLMGIILLIVGIGDLKK